MILNLPKIINGNMIYARQGEDTHQLKYANDVTVIMPKVTTDDLHEIIREKEKIKKELQQLTISDITKFVNQVGELWLDYKLESRRMAQKYAPLLTQFSDIVIEGDYKTMGDFMIQRFHIYDQIESEFGNERIFDEWIPNQMSYIRAFPRGIALHYLVGNLPLAAIYSVLRGIITKNINFSKIPSRDPATAVGFIQSFIETDPKHPISRSLSLGYWKADDEIGDQFLNVADMVCVWGGYDAVSAIKKKIPPNVPLAEFGPRWSASVIDLNFCDSSKAAFRVIEDCAYYDQEACFNSQRVYVKGDMKEFICELKKYFAIFDKNVPYLAHNIDIDANRSIALLEAAYVNCHVEQGKNWAIIIADADSKDEITHPFNRTLFVHQVDDLNQISKYFDRESQTLSVYPWNLLDQYKDTWAESGICRFVELGWSRIFRSGFTHDGIHGMHPFVRIVCMERPWSDPGRYYSLRTNMESYWFLEKYSQYRDYIDDREKKYKSGES